MSAQRAKTGPPLPAVSPAQRHPRSKGSFNLRLDPELHKRLVSNAMSEGKTLNAFVKDLLQRAVSETRA